MFQYFNQYATKFSVILKLLEIVSIWCVFRYANKEEFASDCRLIFDNCEYFNEDDSQIGQAGHKLRAFFENKWLKLFD